MDLGKDKTGLMWHQTTENDQLVCFRDDSIIGVINHSSVLWENDCETPAIDVMLVAAPDATIVYSKEIREGNMDEDFGYVRTPFFGFRLALARRRAARIAKGLKPAVRG